ncbi:MAG: peptidoglycan editing factor PgeF [Nitrospirae bacterium]|nr:peptidoglycan editing factor PgeF [Nitrospirota bacterium]
MAELRFLAPAAAPPSGVLAVFLGRRGGVSPPPYDDLNVGPRVGDAEANVLENLSRIGKAFGVPAARIAVLHQVHGNRILVVKSPKMENGASEPEADGWISDQAGFLFGVRTADCASVLAWDATKGIVGAAHAGWQGTRAGVAAELVRSFIKVFGCVPRDIRCVVGPAIGPCCYEIGLDRVGEVGSVGAPFVLKRNGRTFLDLFAWNLDQLQSAGLAAEQVEVTRICTACRPAEYFSNRRDGPKTGRQLSFIGVR